ncbi:MAG: hypothetical protein HY298_12010 [Verrucomicrobia bacterium]|nr:hypothetical protein [Verrucomicrobiota bacterium]
MKHIDQAHVKAFWHQDDAQLVAPKQGCYIFALRASKGYCPWYVGKATNSMRQECLGPHQLKLYNEVLFDGRKGTPVMFFVVPDAAKNKVPKTICDEIETLLIQSAYCENPELKNSQKKKLPKWIIKGVVRGGKGKRTLLQQVFRKMMGI